MHRIVWMVLAAIASGYSFAAADLAGSVEITPGTFVPPGTTVRVALTIRNNGPDVVDGAGMGTTYRPNVGHRTIEIFPSAETPPCKVRYTDFTLPPPQLSLIGVDVLPANTLLQPGESVTCVVSMSTYPEAPATFTQRFVFLLLDGDPVPGNNIVDVLIRTRLQETVVLPTRSWLGLLLLLAAAIALAAPHLYARNRGSI
jgi:hypothetical protein